MKRSRVGDAVSFARRASSSTSSVVSRAAAVELHLSRDDADTARAISRAQIEAALALLIDDQCTLPFVARYRKERTQGLDELQLRCVEKAARRYEALEAKRASALDALQKLDIQKLDADVLRAVTSASTLEAIEDVMQKFRTKATSRADRARSLRCDALAEALILDGPGGIESLARPYVNGDAIKTVEDALKFAKDVLAERAANETAARAAARSAIWSYGALVCALTADGKAAASGKVDDKTMKKIADAVRDYYEFSAPMRRIKPHQTLAIMRAENAKVLRVKIDFDLKGATSAAMKALLGGDQNRRLGGGRYGVVRDAVEDGIKRLLAPSIEREAKGKLKAEAMERAIGDFGANLRALLLQAPLKPASCVLGVDPAYRTGCKLAVVDERGQLLDTGVVRLPQIESKAKADEGAKTLSALIKRWNVRAIAIGDGVASRETETFIADVVKSIGGDVGWRVVSEAGASVYSASELAAKELPNIDVSLRGAVSIARRLQDPMAELVKIDPAAIGVGLYQHDVKEKDLANALTATVESAVAQVGANLNTSSQSLLSRIPGLGPSLAGKIVRHRDECGSFAERSALKNVPGVGAKTFEQIIGFLRVPDAKDVLEHTSVHPESYGIARRLLKTLDIAESSVVDLTADEDAGTTSMDVLRRLKPKLSEIKDDVTALKSYAAQLRCHHLTLRDIVSDLCAPGEDVRGADAGSRANALRTHALTIDALTPGDAITGVVRNVVPFGIFVDIGVGRDALLHVTAMQKQQSSSSSAGAKPFDPHSAYAVGQTVQVIIHDVDTSRHRISLRL